MMVKSLDDTCTRNYKGKPSTLFSCERFPSVVIISWTYHHRSLPLHNHSIALTICIHIGISVLPTAKIEKLKVSLSKCRKKYRKI